MEPVIRSLTLKGFRSVAAERIEFDNPTFLVGQNGSGKSNLVDALTFISEAMLQPLPAILEKRGGIETICHHDGLQRASSFALKVELGRSSEIESGFYGFEIGALPQGRFEVLREECMVASPDGEVHHFARERGEVSSSIQGLAMPLTSEGLGFPLIGAHQRFRPAHNLLASMQTYSIDPGKLREKQQGGSSRLSRDGGNVALVLEHLEKSTPEIIDRIAELLSAAVTPWLSVKTVRQGSELSLAFTQVSESGATTSLGPNSMSDGILRILGLLVAVYQLFPFSLIALEEPENTVHPGALGLIEDILHIARSRSQVVVTTHSPELLDAKWMEDRHLRIVEWQGDSTRVSRISEGTRRALQERLMGAGEMLRSNSLVAAPLRELDVEQIELFRKAV